MQDLEVALDLEHRGGEEARQALSLLERRRIVLQKELEDLHALFEAVSVHSVY